VMKTQYPEIVDVAMPAEGIFHNLMIVAIRKSYPDMHGDHERDLVAGAGDVHEGDRVVDHDVNIHNYSEVVWKTLCALDPERDVQFVLGPWIRWIMQRECRTSGRRWDRRNAQVAIGRIYAPWPDEILMDEARVRRSMRVEIAGADKT